MRAASRKQQLAKLHKESHPGNAVSTCNKRNEACNRKFVPTKDRANRTLTLGILGLIALLLILFCISEYGKDESWGIVANENTRFDKCSDFFRRLHLREYEWYGSITIIG